MVGSQLRSHMCVQTQYDMRFVWRVACQTERPSRVRREHDGHVVYSVLHVYRRFLEALLHGAIHGYKIILFKSRGRGFSRAVGGAVPPSRFNRDARR